MLYDNAQLLTSAIEAALLADKVEDKIKMERMAAGIVAYLEQDLQNKGGGYFCAEDADSLPGNGETEKKEGAFYGELALVPHSEGSDLLSHSLDV